MKIPSLTSFFKKKSKTLTIPDTLLIKRLKTLSQQSNLLIFKDVNIYHHTKIYKIPLLVLDPLRGLYIFETKEWTYDELKNASIEKAQEQKSSSQTLAFDNTQNIIRQKFNELTHNDGVPIFNYLLMENLNTDEYEHLNDSFKKLLPRDKIIFSDLEEADIFKKLQKASKERDDLPSTDKILGTLLIQYSILDTRNELHLCNSQQIEFIDRELVELNRLNGVHASGKSNLLLLKSIIELFNDNNKKIIIIKPTLLACDLLKKKLLEIVEHAIIEIDLTSIEIITPLELLNRHQEKLKRGHLTTLEIDEKLMQKSFNIADLLMCDDAYLMPEAFIAYLKHIQKKSQLLLVNDANSEEIDLVHNYKLENKTIQFHHTNPHAKALHLIAKLLREKNQNILVVCNTLSAEKLKDDLSSFIPEEAKTLDSSVHLINQSFTNVTLCYYNDTNEIQVEHIILMDICFISKNEIEYALNLSTKTTNILYEEDCQEIKNLRIKYEQSTQERAGVESTTLT